MANINGHEIFFGIVGQVDATEDKLPSWFPNVNPVQDIKIHYGNDLSEYYVDVVFKTNSGALPYNYMRCYCDTADSIKVYTPNGTQIFLSYTVNGSKIAYRAIGYSSDGTSKQYYDNNWDTFNELISNNFDTSKICIINKGKTFTLSTYNLNFLML